MRHLNQRCEKVEAPRAYLRMDFDARQKVRSRAVATNGEVVGIHIERGTSLHDGDCLTDENGEAFMVRAAGEPLSIVSCSDPLDLAKAAYHLGNRHVRLQIEAGRLSYQSDHVLDDMVTKMGFAVEQGVLPFEPEPGAYHSHAKRSEEGHSHSHGNDEHPSGTVFHHDEHHHHHGHESGESHHRIAARK